MDVKPATYRDVDPALFEDIATQKIAPAAGPQPEHAFSSSPKGKGS
jgi:hypothetical protein